MTLNVLQTWPETLGVIAGALALFLFALALVWPLRTPQPAASRGHRKGEDETSSEEVRPDSYIDTFAHTISESGGPLPLALKVVSVGIVVWWLVYLILFWTPR
jgi:hypothetical protein